MMEEALKIEKPQGLLAETMQPLPEETPTTAANQDLTKGDLQIQDDDVYFTPEGGSVPNNRASVADQMGGLLADNSKYLNAARANAMETANQRGLLNSTMAATAGEKAAIEAAMPIATQDAGFHQQSQLQKEQGEIQRGLYETQGDISERLAAQGFEHEKALKEIDIEWNKLDLESRMKVEYDKMAEDRKTEFNNTTNAIATDYEKQYLAILADPNFATQADRQAAVNVLNQTTQERYAIAASIAGVELSWTPTHTTAPPTNSPGSTSTTTFNFTSGGTSGTTSGTSEMLP